MLNGIKYVEINSALKNCNVKLQLRLSRNFILDLLQVTQHRVESDLLPHNKWACTRSEFNSMNILRSTNPVCSLWSLRRMCLNGVTHFWLHILHALSTPVTQNMLGPTLSLNRLLRVYVFYTSPMVTTVSLYWSLARVLTCGHWVWCSNQWLSSAAVTAENEPATGGDNLSQCGIQCYQTCFVTWTLYKSFVILHCIW